VFQRGGQFDGRHGETSPYYIRYHAISYFGSLPQLQKGASSARSDDTKSLKSAIINWLTPPGEALILPIARNMKVDRGYHHEKTGLLLCPTGVDWSDPE